MVYAAIDIHKHAFQAAVLDPDSGEVIEERFAADRESLSCWAEPWRGRLGAVAIEATTGWRWVWRELAARGFEVRLVEPVQARALLGRRRSAKTDRLDARWLARLSAKEMLPQSWVPRPRSKSCAIGRGCARRSPRTGAAGVSACTPTCCTRAGPARGRICSGRPGCAGRRPCSCPRRPPPGRLAPGGDGGAGGTAGDRRGRAASLRPRGTSAAGRCSRSTGSGRSSPATCSPRSARRGRFRRPEQITRLAGLDPVVEESGESRRRGHLAKAGSPHLRWALVEAAVHAHRSTAPDLALDRATRARRDTTVARLTVARKIGKRASHALRELELSSA